MFTVEDIRHKAEASTQVIADAANDLIVPVPIIKPEKRWLWLTLPNCGFAVEVLRQKFIKEGISAEARVNRKAHGERFQDHVVLAIDGNGETIYADPTYLQLFSEFGLDASLVVESWDKNEGNVLPDEHCLVYTESTLSSTVDALSNQVLLLLGQYQGMPIWQHAPSALERPLEPPSLDVLQAFFTQIYDPIHLESFTQVPEKQELISEYLNDYQAGRISVDALFRYYRHRAKS